MPDRIKMLPENVTHMIAAGEVVEGPHSVVKELVENAIDAGAGKIDIEVEDSGFSRIMVRDDGCGIFRDDMVLAVKEHATSKISSIDDIQGIASYGFRGEALSSIAAVSDITILSRRRDEELGSRLENRNGQITLTDYAGPTGTTIIVENIFFNIPARKKFQKSPQAESRAVRETVLRSAIPNCNLTFTLTVNGKKVIDCRATGSRGERIEQLFGSEEMSGLLNETLSDISVKIDGYLSKPHCAKASRNMQYLFVNGRPVEMRNYSFFLSKGYESSIPQGRYPAGFIFIEIKPDLIDVNIHPAKREIKFFDSKYIEHLIIGLIRKAVGRTMQHLDACDLKASEDWEMSYRSSQIKEAVSALKIKENPEELSFDYHASTRDGEISSEDTINPDPADFSVLGTVFGTYVLIERNDEFVIIDFHAAHERINYDRIIAGESGVDVQTLVFPEHIELSPIMFERAEELIDELSEKGFDISPFSDSSIIVHGIPSVMSDCSIREFVIDLIETYENDHNRMKLKQHIVASRIACHASRRAGDNLSDKEMKFLAKQVFSGKFEFTCPHGRPYLYIMKRSEIDRLFSR